MLTILLVYDKTGLRFIIWIKTHTRLTALFPGLPMWAGTRKVKPIWILQKQETVSGSGISWAICKSASRFRQTTTPLPPPLFVFYRPDALPAAQPTASKHWRHIIWIKIWSKILCYSLSDVFNFESCDYWCYAVVAFCLPFSVLMLSPWQQKGRLVCKTKSCYKYLQRSFYEILPDLE